MIGLFVRIPTQSNREDFRRNRELIRPNREFSYGISERGGAIAPSGKVFHRGKLPESYGDQVRVAQIPVPPELGHRV
jgi:hypothetical protein